MIRQKYILNRSRNQFGCEILKINVESRIIVMQGDEFTQDFRQEWRPMNRVKLCHLSGIFITIAVRTSDPTKYFINCTT
jgi:hypothetical protein